MTLCENIREVRKARGMTQEQLAEAMGVSSASVSKWETGQCAPEITMLAALADYFEVSVDTLMGHVVKADRRQALLEELETLGSGNRFGEAKEIGGKLLRNYPNDYDVVSRVAELYYQIHVVTNEPAAMEYSIELVRRLFTLAEDPAGTKRFELLSRLGNQYELLGDWDMARKYYEEGNVAGVNDRELARVLAHEKMDLGAAKAVSKVFVQNLCHMLSDVMLLKDIWEELGQSEKARAALEWGLAAYEGAGSEIMGAYSAMGIALHLNLVGMLGKDADGEVREHIRKAARLAIGRGYGEEPGFLNPDKPQVIASQELGSGEALAALLEKMGLEGYAGIVREEMAAG